MIEFQVSLPRYFEICLDLEEYTTKVCKNCEYKMDHYSRQLHYCSILLSAEEVDSLVQSRDSPTNIPVSKGAQPVEAPCELDLTKHLCSMTLGTGTRLKIPKMTTTSAVQVGKTPSLFMQQQE